MPVLRFETGEQADDKVFDTITDADSRKWAMTAACMVAVDGLYAGHAYTIIGIV
jgi:hypothetical protein